MNATDDSTEELAALEEAQAALTARIAAARQAAEDERGREQREAEQTRQREFERRRQEALGDYFAAREEANALLAEPVGRMVEAIARRFELRRAAQVLGVELSDHFAPRELQPFGQGVDMAYTAACHIKGREEDAARRQEREAKKRPAA